MNFTKKIKQFFIVAMLISNPLFANEITFEDVFNLQKEYNLPGTSPFFLIFNNENKLIYQVSLKEINDDDYIKIDADFVDALIFNGTKAKTNSKLQLEILEINWHNVKDDIIYLKNKNVKYKIIYITPWFGSIKNSIKNIETRNSRFELFKLINNINKNEINIITIDLVLSL